MSKRQTLLKSPTICSSVHPDGLIAPSNFGTLQKEQDLMHPLVRKPYAISSPSLYFGANLSAYSGMRFSGWSDPIPP